MTKEEFIDRRTKIISKMLDNPKEGIYPTTICFAELDDLFDELLGYKKGPSWAQIERDSLAKIDGNIHIMPKDGNIHVENENCFCAPYWDEQNKKDFNLLLADKKLIVHREIKEIVQ